jgi:hypothetical protein
MKPGNRIRKTHDHQNNRTHAQENRTVTFSLDLICGLKKKIIIVLKVFMLPDRDVWLRLVVFLFLLWVYCWVHDVWLRLVVMWWLNNLWLKKKKVSNFEWWEIVCTGKDNLWVEFWRIISGLNFEEQIVCFWNFFLEIVCLLSFDDMYRMN